MTEAQMQELREKIRTAIQGIDGVDSADIIDGEILVAFPDYDIAVSIEPV